jgi:Protein of unknown function (DUF2835)
LRSIIVQLQIGADEFQRLYEGTAKEVVARSLEGQRVRFPAIILRPFVALDGVHGTYHIHFVNDNRFQSIERIDRRIDKKID